MTVPKVFASVLLCLSCGSLGETGLSTQEQAEKNLPVLVDVPSLIGKTQKQVQVLLGKSTCETENVSRVGKIPTCTYDKGTFSVEVTYIKGKADWISVEGLSEELAFKPEAITAVGLPQLSGYQETQAGYFWRDISGYHEISVFPYDESRVNYIYVKAVTD